MRDCDKRQHENYKGTEQNRCIHPESEVRNEIVTETVCDACPLVRIKIKTCKEKRKIVALAEAGRMKYPKAWELPKPLGKQLPVLDLQAGFSSCPYRYRQGEQPMCQITGLGVTPEICNRCDEETREHEASMSDKFVSYFGAVRRWIASGRPTRSEAEIKELFETHCKQCDRYDAEKHGCKVCGCAVSTETTPLGNKLAMATERCPLGRF